jgi:CelD/BcsL family acetyltransferase involved in cellulose biosynthesis
MAWLDSKVTSPVLAPALEADTRPVLDDTVVVAPWKVETLTSIESIASIAGEWNELLSTSRADCLFLTPEWLTTWWKHCGAGDLAVHAIRYGRDLLGIAPLRTAPSRSCPPIHTRAFQFLGTGNVGSDYLDVMVRPARRGQTLDVLATTLARERRVLDLSQLARGSSSALALAERLERRGWRSIRRTIARCPHIAFDGRDFEGYLESLGASHRANFRRRLRQLAREFEVEWQPARDESERREAIEILFHLHHDRFSDRGGSDALHTEALRDFHRELSGVALRRGWLRLWVLRLDQRPAAALYAFRYGRGYLFYQAGFAREFTRWSVGLVAMGLAIRAAIEEGAEEFDLLHGDETYKSLWAGSARELERIELFPPTLSGHTHRLLRRGARAARDMATRRQGEASPAPPPPAHPPTPGGAPRQGTA